MTKDAIERAIGGIEPPSRPRSEAQAHRQRDGVRIEIQTQVLTQAMSLIGTPFTLRYRSDRTPGRSSAASLRVPLSGQSVPRGLKRIDLEIIADDQRYTRSFPPKPDQTHTLTRAEMDIKPDAARRVRVRIGYVYDSRDLARSGALFTVGDDLLGQRDRIDEESTRWQEWKAWIGGPSGTASKLGGWTIDSHHAYDRNGGILYPGDGTRRSVDTLPPIVARAGTNRDEGSGGDSGIEDESNATVIDGGPCQLACGPDGSVYVAETGGHRIHRIDDDGMSTLIAGTGESGFDGDGESATRARLDGPGGITVASDGNVYVADTGNDRIRRVDSEGNITTIAGSGEHGYSGDGGPATAASLARPRGLVVEPDGSIVFADSGNGRVRRVDPDGIITTVAGGMGSPDEGGIENPGRETIGHPIGIARRPDDDLYVLDDEMATVWRIMSDEVQNVGGGHEFRDIANGGAGVVEQLQDPQGIAADVDGNVYVTEPNDGRIRRITPEKVVTTVVGERGDEDANGESGLMDRIGIRQPWGITAAPDGSLFVADRTVADILQVGAPASGCSLGDAVIPSDDGRELYVFDDRGRHRWTVDALSEDPIYRFTYGDDGVVTAIEDDSGNVTTIERGEDSTTIVSPHGQRTTLSIGDDGYVETITDPDGSTTQFSYDDGLIRTQTDPNGNVVRFDYDESGRLVEKEDPTGDQTDLVRTRTTDGFSVTLVTPELWETTFAVERRQSGEERQVTTCCGIKIIGTRETDGTYRLHYPDGMQVKIGTALDARFGAGTPTSKRDVIESPSGLTTTISLTRSAMLSLNASSRLRRLTETVDVDGHAFEQVYDATDRTITATSAAGREYTTTIGKGGRWVEDRVGEFAPIRYDYDDRGRLAEVAIGTGTDARVREIRYDDGGFVDAVTDPMGRDVRYEQDAAGRVTRRVHPDGREYAYDYDANGNLTAITLPAGTVHRFEYDAGNRLVGYKPPDTNADVERESVDSDRTTDEPTRAEANAERTRYTYDGDGHLTAITRPGGQRVDVEYDAGWRPSAIEIGRGRIRYMHDEETGRLVEVTSPDGDAVTYEYDGAQPTAITSTGTVEGTVEKTYDDGVRVRSVSVDGDAGVPYEYDDDGVPVRVGELALNRDDNTGLPVSSTLGLVTDTWQYNEFVEPESHDVSVDGSTLYAVEYTYDVLGRIATTTETVAGQTDEYRYTYDGADRLAEVEKNGTTVATYTYGANGNRIRHRGPDGTVTATYDDQDRLVRYGDGRYTYTAAGELRTKIDDDRTTEYTYDALGNLVEVTLSDGTNIEYTVDGQNRRIATTVDGTPDRRFLYADDRTPIAELDPDGSLRSRFVYGTDTPHGAPTTVPEYMVRNGTTYRFICDRRGSPRLIVDTETGRIEQRMEYDAFGTVLTDTNAGFQPFGFAGGLYDAKTGLTRFGARDYDAFTGRWMTKDPQRFASDDPNMYAYVQNDPINYVDPYGTDRFEICERGGRASRWLCRKAVEWACSGTRSAHCCDTERRDCYSRLGDRDGICETEMKRCQAEWTRCMRGVKEE